MPPFQEQDGPPAPDHPPNNEPIVENEDIAQGLPAMMIWLELVQRGAQEQAQLQQQGLQQYEDDDQSDIPVLEAENNQEQPIQEVDDHDEPEFILDQMLDFILGDLDEPILQSGEDEVSFVRLSSSSQPKPKPIL
ncbi:hypothetical protein K456DRAFT_1908298 [Colletotrichum gloeosporioides 23]|nr:hypothetical protein K456DRAFT_1908298 [Colletotrichum gloeosporioides 23]KAJ0280386.1 hypothetical protein CBS470a_008824 [Colletotrichum nupharicola]KAJ0283717.1 hypothetical protein COL940_004499 [Colletotrichum noveboracense]